MSFVVPAEAPPPAPRPFRVRATDAGTAFLMLFGGIWALVGTIIAVVFTAVGGPLWNDLILDRRAVVAAATPISVKFGNGQINGRPLFRIDYTFRDDQGHAQSGATSTTDGLLLSSARTGGPLSVEYDPQQPSRSRVKGQSASAFGLFVLIPLGFAVVGGGVLLVGLQRFLRLRAIYVRGHAATATVTDVSPGMMRINERPVLRVGYAFATSSSAAQIGGRTTMRRAPAVGDKLWILYDPDDPQRNVAAV